MRDMSDEEVLAFALAVETIVSHSRTGRLGEDVADKKVVTKVRLLLRSRVAGVSHP
jgi:hypothetical protein